MSPAGEPSGLACNCVCPGCGARLIARHGAGITSHFAHYEAQATPSCVESAIHAAAKQVLLEHYRLQVPHRQVTVSARTLEGDKISRHKLLTDARTIQFDYCKEEVWEGDVSVRPDIVGYRGGRRMHIEMCFTHRVDDVKLRKLQRLGIPAIEIDLSDFGMGVDLETIKERVLNDVAHKEWLVYPREEAAREQLSEELRVEVEAVNQQFTRKEALRRKSEARKKEQAEIVQQKIVAAQEQYRALPLAEKEHQLRDRLGFKGAWPYYLNRISDEARAINAPVHLWQAALFERFVFEKQDSRHILELKALTAWVAKRFGLVDQETALAGVAVSKLLRYLRGCGFLKKHDDNPYEPTNYSVVHGALQPPPRPLTPVKVPVAAVAKEPPTPPPTRSVENWLWRASWPARADILASAQAFLQTSPYQKELAPIAMMPRAQCPDPIVLASRLEKAGVPRDMTLLFLQELGLAFKHMQPSK